MQPTKFARNCTRVRREKRERQTEPLGAAYDTLEPLDATYGAEKPWLFCYMKEGVVFGLAWWEDHEEILNYIYHVRVVSWKQYPLDNPRPSLFKTICNAVNKHGTKSAVYYICFKDYSYVVFPNLISAVYSKKYKARRMFWHCLQKSWIIKMILLIAVKKNFVYVFLHLHFLNSWMGVQQKKETLSGYSEISTVFFLHWSFDFTT